MRGKQAALVLTAVFSTGMARAGLVDVAVDPAHIIERYTAEWTWQGPVLTLKQALANAGPMTSLAWMPMMASAARLKSVTLSLTSVVMTPLAMLLKTSSIRFFISVIAARLRRTLVKRRAFSTASAD